MLERPTTQELVELAQGTLGEWLGGYRYLENPGRQIQFRQMDDGTWNVDAADGIRAAGELGTYRIRVCVERVQ